MKHWSMLCLPCGLATALASPRWSLAAEEEAARSGSGMPVEPLGAGSVFQMIGGLILVLAIIFALAWIVRRFGRLNFQSGNSLRVMAALSMGSRERIVLIQAGDTQILVGVAPGRVQTLHVMDRPIAEQPRSADATGFGTKLRQAMTGATES